MSPPSSTISGSFTPTKGATRKRSRCTSVLWRSATKPTPTATPISRSPNCNLAVVYHARGDLTRAEELYRESMRGWENVQKPPEDYQIVASNYADLLRSLGKKRKAGAIEARARKRRGR